MREEPLNQLNMTPLIDVMLVLIIMLIVTIPKANHQLGLNLPTHASDAKPPTPQTLEVDFDGSLAWNGAPVESRAALEAKLAALGGEDSVHIRSNGLAPYKVVAGVLATAQRQGVQNIAIVGNERFQ